MKRISYENFKELLLRYTEFNNNTFNAFMKQFGKSTICEYFDKLVEENDFRYAKYIEYYMLYGSKNNDMVISNFAGVFGDITCNASKYDILSSKEEKIHTRNVCIGRDNLTILEDTILKNKKSDNNDILYPRINLGKIFISIKDVESLELLKEVRKLPFILNDDNILKEQKDVIKKFIKLSSNGILTEKEIKDNFPTLDYSSKLDKKDIDNELKMFKDYIISKNKLYNANIRLVSSIARNFCKIDSILVEDKMQEGCLGLIRAINKFDYTRDIRLATYATNWIKERITKYVSENNDNIRKPIDTYREIVTYRNFIYEYTSKNGVEPTDNEIMEFLGCDKKKLERIRKGYNTTLSLNAVFDCEKGEDYNKYVYDVSEPFEDKIDNKSLYDSLKKMLEDNLSESDLDIFYKRNGINTDGTVYTLEEIGKSYNVSKQRIRQRVKSISNNIDKLMKLDSYC